MSDLRVFLFGGVRMEYGDHPLELKAVRAIQPLVAYLVLHRHRTHSREKLADLFWGDDHDQDRARGCLRTALCRLRRALESGGVAPETYLLTALAGEVGFNPESDYWLDVEAFEDQANEILARPVHAIEPHDAQKLENALQLYTGDLLEDFYDDWVLWERERLQRLYLNGLAHLMRYHKRLGAYKESIECAHQILACNPLREEIHREMMRLYLESGQRALAVRQYEVCREILASELQIPPMAETQALFARAVSDSVQPERRLANGEELTCVQRALQQICQSVSSLDTAQRQLQKAIQLIEQVRVP